MWSCPSSASLFTFWWMDWSLFDFLNLSICHLLFTFISYVKRIKTVSWGGGGRKCGAFLSSLDRDPHPTCTRCRGKICTMDLTCDICVEWSSAHWEAFAKKRSYAERKRSRPSGSFPPARTSMEVKHLGASSSSSSLPSGGQVKEGRGGGVSGCTWCCVM